LTRFQDFEEKCAEYEKKHTVKVIRLNDGEGVMIDSESVSVYRV